MITWHFKGHEIYFSSEEEKLDRHILQNRNRLQTDAEVVIITENGSTNHDPATDLNSSDGDSAFEDVETLDHLLNPDQSEGEEALRLRDVFDDVDSTTAPPVFVEGNLSNSNVSSTGNSVPRKRNR